MISLPIDAVLPELVAKLRTGAVVLQAPTGAGKTTRVPPAVMNDKLTLLLEPRRVAARAAARRMAFEDGSPLGERFGYHVRFDRKASPRTRVLTVTPGILLRYLQDDPFLETIGTILFDEFHERGQESDLALGMVRLLRQTVRPDLRALVMSATIDGNAVAAYLGDCPLVISEGRSFPVAIRYRPRRAETPMVDAAASAVREILNETAGDVLVFLPGLGEIRRVEERLGNVDAEVLPLHGELPPEQQDRALQKLPRRKIVLATNVAETSVTVDGVTAVIDTGQSRIMEFDAGMGMNRLRLAAISKASADQRAGRAGRTQPGLCVRLWDEPGHRARPAQTEPEVRRVDLAPAVLQLLSLGEDPATFPWLDAPKPDAVAQAIALLKRLGAMANNALTMLGIAMAALPVHPRLARLMLSFPEPSAALACAILSERDPFERDSARGIVATHSDLLDRVEALEEFEQSGRMQFPQGSLHRHGARQLLQARDQLLRSLPRSPSTAESLLHAVYLAYPDRLCRRRNRHDPRALMVGGRGVRLGNGSGVTEPDLFVAIDVDAGESEAWVRMASEVKREWLTVTTNHEMEFDDKSQRIVPWKRSRCDGLIVDETPGHIGDDREAARILAEHAAKSWDMLKPSEESAAGQFLIRLAYVPTLALPDQDTVLQQVALGCRSFEEIRRGNWLEAMKACYTWPQLQMIEREAPETITVPSGREVTLAYVAGRPPVLAAKIQELFGLSETPRIGNGKVIIHLLAPNGRPQQVTDDLASFWANTYATIRKELRGRYPKHDWPEDPTTAVASRGVRRKSP